MEEFEEYKNLIISHLEGNIREKDLIRLLDWLDKNPDQKKKFFEIKHIWDSRLQNTSVQIPPMPECEIRSPEKRKRRSIRHILINMGKYAAIILITIGVNRMFFTGNSVGDELSYNQVIMQNGKQSQLLILSDGSKVWINASSSLKYPTSFETGQRSVWLDGEAYFEVAEKKDQPFVVHTNLHDIKVTGTSFNVNAYDGNDKVITTLVEGEVQLWLDGKELATLTPNQQSIFIKEENGVTLTEIDPSLYTAWKDGFYKFYNTSFEEIAERLEKMHNVDIIFTDKSLLQIPYSGTFVQDQNIQEILDIMQNVKPFKYTMKDKTVTISK